MNKARWLRFALVGSMGFAVDVTLVYVLLYFGCHYVLARVLSFLVAVTVTWFGNRRFTFGEAVPPARWQEWFHYTLTNAVGGVFNIVVYSLWMRLHEDFSSGWAPLTGAALGSVAALFFNYWVMSRYVFKPR